MDGKIYPADERYAEYFRDESQFCGNADEISFPDGEAAARSILRELRRRKVPVTVQGGKTGIVGSGVPLGGHLMNVSNFNRVTGFSESGGARMLTVEPGLRLSELRRAVAGLESPVRLFWPPDPTETSATLGGIAAMDASGISAFAYGPTRNYIEAARVILADGTMREIRRGENFLEIGGLRLDELDAFLGGEGMLGMFAALTLRLIPRPAEQWGIAFFFSRREDAWLLADRLQRNAEFSRDAKVTAAEYADRESLGLVEVNREIFSALNGLPAVAPEADAMIYLEISGEETGVESAAETLMGWAEECGGDPDGAWAVSGEKEIETLRAYRHAIPESVNLAVAGNHRSCPKITKLSTDLSFPGRKFSDVMGWYRKKCEPVGPARCVFGHIGDSHVHCNFLAKDAAQQERCERWMSSALREASGLGARAVGENGIGKLKRRWIPADGEPAARMRALKERYDPDGFWNPGNMFPSGPDGVPG